MVRLIYGSAGSGKSTLVLELARKSALSGKKTLIIVPEQQVLETEDAVSRMCENDKGVYVEVLSLGRLCNDIFREYGGLCYNYIGKGGRLILMWRAISSVADLLCEYKKISAEDLSVARLMLSAVNEFRMYNVLPEEIARASEECENKYLAKKLSDISVIYRAYLSAVESGYDDSSNDLVRAAEKLADNNYFEKTTVLIDSFDGFTPQESVLLEKIFAQSSDLTVTLGYKADDRREMYEKLRRTDKLVRTLFSKVGKGVDEVVELCDRSKSRPALTYAVQNVWKYGVSVFDKEAEGIATVRCSGAYEEAAYVCADIRRKVECGARYKDFAVIARDTSAYDGILDSAFSAANIPYFVSERTGIMSMPETRMIISVLNIRIRGFRSEDVFSYMRCGLSGLSLYECDELEEYASTWKINGRRWYDSIGWGMNPRGYTADRTDSVKERLKIINSHREKLISPIVCFFEKLDKAKTVRAISTSLYEFLSDMRVREKLSARAEKMRAENENDRAEEAAMAWNALMSALDELVHTAGDTPVTVSEYFSLFKAVVSEIDMGKIPTRNDEVTVARADLFRKTGIKHVYIIGAEEGSFPLTAAGKSLLTDAEKTELEALGISVAPFGDNAYFDEQLYFYKSLAVASETATVLFSEESEKSAPSSAVVSLESLFENIRINFSDIPLIDRAYAISDILSLAALYRDTELIDELERSGIFSAISSLKIPYTAQNDRIDATFAEEYFDKHRVLSHSKLEKYIMCPFSYHCKYVLKLEDMKSGEFESLDVGNFVHKILEIYFSAHKDDFRGLTDDEIKQFSDLAVDGFVSEIWEGEPSSRIKGLVKRLKKLSVMLIKNITEEFMCSDFRPMFFELPLGIDDGETPFADGASFELDDGTRAFITGKVDRVDVYKKGRCAYVRIVDYKTGSKEFSLKDVEQGLNMQMLIYLFALCSEEGDKFRRMLDCDETVPAGILYFPARMPDKNDSGKGTRSEQAREALKRNGYLLNDEEILEAMEHSGAGLFVPTSKNLYSLTELGEIKIKIDNTLRNIAKRMKEGEAYALPLEHDKRTPCSYCTLKPLCRAAKKGGV